MRLRNAVLIAAVLAVAPLARANEVLPFIDNDYTKAVAHAKAKNLPIFVEAWAPW